jgi:hypothetical protein
VGLSVPLRKRHSYDRFVEMIFSSFALEFDPFGHKQVIRSEP